MLFIFISIIYLYSLPLNAIFYFVILSIAVELLIFILNFHSFYKKHKLLSYLKNQIVFNIENLPFPNNLIEADYQKLLKLLNEEKNRIYIDYKNKEKDAIDYYTLWAHQIKTPVAAMRLLLQNEDTDFNRELSSELFKIEQYVNIVLQYLRLGSDSTDYNFKPQNLDYIVKQAIRKYAPLFIRKKISLNLSDLTVTVISDEKWLVFVIEQILSNALKYTPSGSISIYREVFPDKTLLVIKDTGIGIASEDLPRIFEKSFTGYNGRIDQKATGLGLYLCKQILNKLSHTIEIESTINVGTTVTIIFHKFTFHCE